MTNLYVQSSIASDLPASLRLSKLALSRRTRNKTDLSRANAVTGNKVKELTKHPSPPKSTSPYLEFISEKPKDRDDKTDGRDLESRQHEDSELVPSSSDDVEASTDESRFRDQVERIVNRAASMVVKEQQQATVEETDTNTSSVGSSFGDSAALTFSTTGEVETCGDDAGSVKPKCIPSIEDEIRQLEGKVASLCAVKRDGEEDTASLLSGSLFDYSTAQSAQSTAFCSSSTDDPFSSYSWMHTNSSSEQESSCNFLDITDTTDGRIAVPRSRPNPVSNGEDSRAALQDSQVHTAMQPGQDDEDEPLPNKTMNVVPEVCGVRGEGDRCPQPRGSNLSIQEDEATCPMPRTESASLEVDSQRLRTANDLLWLLG